jgi:transposase
MNVDIAALPDDPKILKQLIVQLFTELQELKRQNEQLRHQNNLLRRKLYGKKSEKLVLATAPPLSAEAKSRLPPGFLEDLLKSAIRPQDDPEKPQNYRLNGHGRQRLPETLRRIVRVHDVPPEDRSCKRCGCALDEIDEEVSEQLEYEPAHLYVVVHVRKTLACKKGCGRFLITADVPVLPIQKGMAGPSLLAWTLLAKYADHLPLYRQEKIFARHGVELARSTLCDWVAQAADVYEPLCRKMAQDTLKSKKLHTDDTKVPVLDPTRDQTREGRMWVYVGDEAHAHNVFDYSQTREKKHPEKFLGDYQGYIQADAWVGYDATFSNGKAIEVACNAHSRRYFFDAKDTDPERGLVAIAFYQKLYAIEDTARGRSPEDRKAIRQEHARPIWDQFRIWLDQEKPKVLPKSPIGEAVGYLDNQWTALTRYLEDGILEIDNNRAENIQRPLCVGRRNWLFVGSDEGGRRAAIIYTLISSCQRHGINPFEYLKDVLERIATHPANDMLQLAPQNWKPRRPKPNTS